MFRSHLCERRLGNIATSYVVKHGEIVIKNIDFKFRTRIVKKSGDAQGDINKVSFNYFAWKCLVLLQTAGMRQFLS